MHGSTRTGYCRRLSGPNAREVSLAWSVRAAWLRNTLRTKGNQDRGRRYECGRVRRRLTPDRVFLALLRPDSWQSRDMSAPSHPQIEADWLPLDPTSSSWADVPPTFQDDGPADALCQIMYDPAYSSAMDLFRTLYPRKELSPRTLALTTHLARLNPSSYSIWSYRADILIDANEDAMGAKTKRLQDELDWMEATTKDNLKSYQVWQHRRLILSALSASRPDNSIDIPRELAFVSSVLSKDAKNYHTWAYRQWILSQYAQNSDQTWKDELKYTDDLLRDDGRNNSAWNHRFFLLFGSKRAETHGPVACGLGESSGMNASPLEDCIRIEVSFIKRHISLTPSNIAPFVYLRGILQQKEGQTSMVHPLSSFSLDSFMASLLPSRLLEQDLAAALPTAVRLPVPVLEYLLDIYGDSKQTSQAQIQRLTTLLIQQDPIRKSWWEMRRTELSAAS